MEETINKDVWNIASTFPSTHISIQLFDCQNYIKIALFGVTHIADKDSLDSNQIAQNRIDAMNWYIETLKQVLMNNSFVMKQEKVKKNIDMILDTLNNILDKIPDLYDIRNNAVNKTCTILIKEPEFRKTLAILRVIHSDIIQLLNRHNLIFGESAEINLKGLKDMISKGEL